jgi:hypothetical protein
MIKKPLTKDEKRSPLLGSGLRETHFRHRRHYFAPLNLKLALSLSFELRQSAPIRPQNSGCCHAVNRFFAQCPIESC